MPKFILPVTLVLVVGHAVALAAYPVTAEGQPGVLTVRAAGTRSIRVTLKPQSFKPEFPENSALPGRTYPGPAMRLRQLKKPVTATIAGLSVTVRPDPLRLTVAGQDGELIQSLTFETDGSAGFTLDDRPVLGMGEGGPRPSSAVDFCGQTGWNGNRAGWLGKWPVPKPKHI